MTLAAFTIVGLYGGAVQAGVGLIMLALLTRAGYDLIEANNVKVVANLVLTAVALPVFIWQGNVALAAGARARRRVHRPAATSAPTLP